MYIWPSDWSHAICKYLAFPGWDKDLWNFGDGDTTGFFLLNLTKKKRILYNRRKALCDWRDTTRIWLQRYLSIQLGGEVRSFIRSSQSHQNFEKSGCFYICFLTTSQGFLKFTFKILCNYQQKGYRSSKEWQRIFRRERYSSFFQNGQISNIPDITRCLHSNPSSNSLCRTESRIKSLSQSVRCPKQGYILDRMPVRHWAPVSVNCMLL